MTDKDKKPEEIIEETMQEIYDDINNSDDFKTGKETDEEEKETAKAAEESDDTDDISDDDNHFETGEDGIIYLDDEEISESDEDADEEELDADSDYSDLEDEEEDHEEYMEETEAQKELRKSKKRKKAAIIAGSIAGVLLLLYFGAALFFNSHFLPFTKINGIDFSMKSVQQVEEYMQNHVAGYVLTLEEADGGKETIGGSDISIKYVPDDQLKKLAKKQNNFLWIKSLWDNPEITAKIGVEYNKEVLQTLVGKLNLMVAENQTPSVDAHPEFKDTEFVIVPEVVGTQVETEKFNQTVKTAIDGLVDTVDLSKEGCYIKPRFLSDSQEVIAAKDAMNKYLGANITYDFNPNTEVVNAAVISQWVKVDQNMNVTFDETAVRAFVQSLADKYNTKGKTRTFVSGSGNTVTVEGGGYGWRIDQDAEYNALIANIQNAETVTREANYSSRAASHGDNDFGSTYAEVDLTNQQMYFIKDGQVVLQSACVTGNTNKGNGTPAGTFSLTYKAKNQTLRGKKLPDGTYEYETPVEFWMPFNGGVGFHDATWQPTFGGQRYLTNGSHGCVNLPYNVASQLYGLISAGVPVIVHY